MTNGPAYIVTNAMIALGVAKTITSAVAVIITWMMI